MQYFLKEKLTTTKKSWGLKTKKDKRQDSFQVNGLSIMYSGLNAALSTTPELV